LKLLTKSTYYFLLLLSFVLIAGAVLLYFTIRRGVYRQIDNSLITEKVIIQDQIEQTDTIPDFEASFGHQIEIRVADSHLREFQVINDTIMPDSVSGDNLPFRYIFYSGNTDRNKGYTIRILQTLSEKKELLEDISLYMFFLFLSLFLISILLNYLISRKLWDPFYETVDKAEKFDIQSDKPIDLPETNIKEFKQLNMVFNQMTRKMRSDYVNLKEYNENSAHEIQTPLAIIRSKLEILMQRKELKKDSINLIKSIDEATTRLLKLNQGLLLISKIDNLYFRDEREISLSKIVESSIVHYREIMQLKKISVTVEANDPAVVRMNETLAEVLVSNLISNAVRYNIDGGFIKCYINNDYLEISNIGVPLKADPELLFHRFHRNSENPQSIGLGLSIVKKITDTYRMKIIYTCSDNIHKMRLEYKPETASASTTTVKA
jgi:signal transduction histidine kinase